MTNEHPLLLPRHGRHPYLRPEATPHPLAYPLNLLESFSVPSEWDDFEEGGSLTPEDKGLDK